MTFEDIIFPVGFQLDFNGNHQISLPGKSRVTPVFLMAAPTIRATLPIVPTRNLRRYRLPCHPLRHRLTAMSINLIAFPLLDCSQFGARAFFFVWSCFLACAWLRPYLQPEALQRSLRLGFGLGAGLGSGLGSGFFSSAFFTTLFFSTFLGLISLTSGSGLASTTGVGGNLHYRFRLASNTGTSAASAGASACALDLNWRSGRWRSQRPQINHVHRPIHVHPHVHPAHAVERERAQSDVKAKVTRRNRVPDA